jgi:hypothetical protein
MEWWSGGVVTDRGGQEDTERETTLLFVPLIATLS